jgi:membrane-associated phospholipid phosphatase
MISLQNRRLALIWILVVAGGGALNMLSKSFFERARPGEDLRSPLVHERNHSYPSGHAMGSTIGYGMLGYALVTRQKRRERKFATILILGVVIAGIGLSRIYLRAHWFSDVVAGWSIGLAWLCFCLGWVERRPAWFPPPKL